MERITNSVWTGAVFGAVFSVLLPLLVIMAVTVGVRVEGDFKGPRPDPVLTAIGGAVLIAAWIACGAVNGALGVLIGRRQLAFSALLPASVVLPVAMVLAEWDSRAEITAEMIVVGGVLAGCLAFSGLAGRVLGRPVLSADGPSSQPFVELPRVSIAKIAWIWGLLLAGASIAAVYFVCIDRDKRRTDCEWKILSIEQSRSSEREAWERDRKRLVGDVDTLRQILANREKGKQ